MRFSQVLIALVCVFALAFHQASAIPFAHHYDAALAERRRSVPIDPQTGGPIFPNPRDDPDFYAHRYTDEYLSHGFDEYQPAPWTQRVLGGIATFAQDVGSEAWSMFKFFSPYFSTKEYSDSNSFTTNTGASKASAVEKDVEDDPTYNGTAMPNLPQDSGFDYRNTKVRGVNIGNWLLFELWMDSDLAGQLNSHAVNAPYPNAIVDEWTAGQYGDKHAIANVLRSHFDTWFTEQDVIDIKAAGLNHMRIPFPYWGFADAKGNVAPYLTLNRFDKLVEACGWARTHGVKVWVDIHGVPGSQNGFDNSGRAGPIHWANNPDYYKRTQLTFTKLAQFFAADEWHGTVTGIEAVNEPKASSVGAIKNLMNRYYPWARNVVARPSGTGAFTSLLMVMHDGFLGLRYFENYFTERASHRVLLDTHPYFVYTPEQKRAKDSQRLREVCANEAAFKRSKSHYPTIAGEMSSSGPNGDRSSDRDLPRAPVTFPDGPNYPYSKKYMAFMARNFAVQTKTFEKGSGWIFWAWYNRNAHDWSYKTGLKYGWIPKDAGAPSPFGNDPCANYR